MSVAAGTTITVLLWGDTPTHHRDAFDIGWKSAAAVLAILAAFVTVERLRLSQREHHRQLDNDEATHINTLSSQASEQLGSDKAAVRIGGLTDLERLAEQYPNLRQTVVDRICAYLRAPYHPPFSLAARAAETEPASTGMSANYTEPSPPEHSDDEIAARRLELDVRRTAQQILCRHLRNQDSSKTSLHAFWEDISLDLQDAVLIEIDFTNCRIASADFRNATIYGRALFGGARFDERADFNSARFDGVAEFSVARFDGGAVFTEARFDRGAAFINAKFVGGAAFGGAKFHKTAEFSKAKFDRFVAFADVNFDRDVRFRNANFLKGVEFSEAKFNGVAAFKEATFHGDALFAGAKFHKLAEFSGVKFNGLATFTVAKFNNAAMFSKAKLEGEAWFSEATHKAEIVFDEARVGNSEDDHVWPDGWRVEEISRVSGKAGRLVRLASTLNNGPRQRSGDEPEADV
ncbi:pentapeptide repeat-containing protein [Amycolatopsis sp. NPDC089917]|uniref:pentapeptide repeat-containing protein n=1 Tax=Amycolatopsis sp. NPDC089917 TaxID=3155187 RepID=UPI003438904B